jgi:hypothetical protein
MPLGEFKRCDTCGQTFETDRTHDTDTCEDCVFHRDSADNAPEEEDLVTKDRIRFYRVGFGHKGPVVVVADPEEGWQAAVQRYMDKECYWSDVWLEEERGGYTNITTEKP